VITATIAFIAVFATTRIVSMGSIVAATILPLAVVFFEFHGQQPSKTIIVFVFITCGWVIYKHRTNITRLREGTESKVGGNGTPETKPEDSES